MSQGDRPVVGQIFVVPLYEGGYAFGYPSYVKISTMHLCNFFDFISETDEVNLELIKRPLVIEDFPIGSGEFFKIKSYPERQWRVTSFFVPGDIRARKTVFIMGSSPLYYIVDIYDPNYKRRATPEEVDKYPHISYKFPPFTTKQIEVRVRHLDIDPKLIGMPRNTDSPSN